MRDRHHAYVCVGGPLDGRRYASRDFFFKAVEHPPLVTPIDPVDPPPMVFEMKHTVYVADRLKTKEGKEAWLWRPEDQTMVATLEKLLERYEQSHNLIFSGTPARLR